MNVATNVKAEKKTEIRRTRSTCVPVFVQDRALEAEVTDLHVIRDRLPISGFEKAESGKDGLGELMMRSLEHAGAARGEVMQHLHGACVVERDATLVEVDEHAHFVCRNAGRHQQVAVVVPRRETPVPKLQTPRESVPSQF